MSLTVYQGPNVILVVHKSGSFVSLSSVCGESCQRIGCDEDATMLATAFRPNDEGEVVAARHVCEGHLGDDYGPMLAMAMQVLERGPLQ